MRTTTLTITKTSTLTATKMLTATLTLALANAAALAMVPLHQRPFHTAFPQCPVQSLDFEYSCGPGKYTSLVVTCVQNQTPFVLAEKSRTEPACLPASAWEERAILACQGQCGVE